MENEITEIQWSWSHPVIQEILLKYYRDWLFNTPEIANSMVEKILSLSSIQPPSKILDIRVWLGIPCGGFFKKRFSGLCF